MSFSRIISTLDSYLDSGGKRRDALLSLLLSSKISQNTFDLMDKNLNRLTSLVSDLKQTLEKEETFWKASLSEETRILECLLIELELKRLLGEIEEEEWTWRTTIINLALDSLKKNETLTDKIGQEPALPVQTTLEENPNEKVGIELKKEDRLEPLLTPAKSSIEIKSPDQKTLANNDHSLNRRRKYISKEPPDLASSMKSKARCMNPWKPECRNIDIGLSIYYKGQMVPICRRCWEDISKKNVEWSSL